MSGSQWNNLQCDHVWCIQPQQFPVEISVVIYSPARLILHQTDVGLVVVRKINVQAYRYRIYYLNVAPLLFVEKFLTTVLVSPGYKLRPQDTTAKRRCYTQFLPHSPNCSSGWRLWRRPSHVLLKSRSGSSSFQVRQPSEQPFLALRTTSFTKLRSAF
jgi:hypothetical protein